MENVILLSERFGVRQQTAFVPGHSADIIIFQGVRFERLTEDMIAQTQSRQRRLPALQHQATAEDLD